MGREARPIKADRADAPQGGHALIRPVRPSGFDSIQILMQLFTNKQGRAIMNGGNRSVASAQSWPASAAGYCPSALHRCCHRRGSEGAKGQERTGVRRGKRDAETNETKREVMARSAGGRGPNPRLQRTRPLWRFLLKLKSSGWGRAAEAGR